MFPVGGDIPGTLKPSASSRVYRVPLFGARGRARAVGVAKGCRRWEENPARPLHRQLHVGFDGADGLQVHLILASEAATGLFALLHPLLADELANT